MDEEGFHGIACGRFLCLGIEADLVSHGKISRFIYKNMAYPFVMLQNRNARMLDNASQKLLPASRYHEVDIFLQGEEIVDVGTIVYINQLDNLWCDTGPFKSLLN